MLKEYTLLPSILVEVTEKGQSVITAPTSATLVIGLSAFPVNALTHCALFSSS